MLFSSIPFLYYFLPCVLILYFLAPRQLKNSVLLIASLVFYGWGEPIYLLLMLASIAVGFFSGILVEHATTQKSKKAFMLSGVIITLSFLLFFSIGKQAFFVKAGHVFFILSGLFLVKNIHGSRQKVPFLLTGYVSIIVSQRSRSIPAPEKKTGYRRRIPQ